MPTMSQLNYFHVDVFAHRPYSGNGLAVFLQTDNWPADFMQTVTEEKQQFESIFLADVCTKQHPYRAKARIFTVEEELPFAGHPLLGAAAVLHRTHAPNQTTCDWEIGLGTRTVAISSTLCGDHFDCEMNQGLATIRPPLSAADVSPILGLMGLDIQALRNDLAPQVISTGLDYLILPIHSTAMNQVQFQGGNLEASLAQLQAKFVFLFDVDQCEIRTWDNAGKVEDIATGSAAGPAAAYLYEHKLRATDHVIQIQQGRFRQRPSILKVRQNQVSEILVAGSVWNISAGFLEALPTR